LFFSTIVRSAKVVDRKYEFRLRGFIHLSCSWGWLVDTAIGCKTVSPFANICMSDDRYYSSISSIVWFIYSLIGTSSFLDIIYMLQLFDKDIS
jgi:hypothetical protein